MADQREMSTQEAITELVRRIDLLAKKNLELELAFRSFASLVGGILAGGEIIERDRFVSLLDAQANLAGQVLAEMTSDEAEPNHHLSGVAENIRALESANPFEVIDGGKQN